MNALSLQNKVHQILARTTVTHRPVSFRTVVSRHGNPLLGLGQDRANVDELVSPPPVVELLRPDEVASSGSLLQLGDYRFTFAGQLPETTLKTAQILYGDDVLRILSYEPIVYQGLVIAWVVLARTLSVQP